MLRKWLCTPSVRYHVCISLSELQVLLFSMCLNTPTHFIWQAFIKYNKQSKIFTNENTIFVFYNHWQFGTEIRKNSILRWIYMHPMSCFCTCMRVHNWFTKEEKYLWIWLEIKYLQKFRTLYKIFEANPLEGGYSGYLMSSLYGVRQAGKIVTVFGRSVC